MNDYFPAVLWPDFSILVTIKPAELQGGFIFAIMDKLESVVQFGVSLSAGDNPYTQTVDLWYTDNIEQVKYLHSGIQITQSWENNATILRA